MSPQNSVCVPHASLNKCTNSDSLLPSCKIDRQEEGVKVSSNCPCTYIIHYLVGPQLQSLLCQFNQIIEGGIQFSQGNQVESSDKKALSDVRVPSTASSIKSDRKVNSENLNLLTLFERCHCLNGNICALMSNGKRLNNNMIYNGHEQDDSGFGSGSQALHSSANSDSDLAVLKRNVDSLKASGCYYGPMDSVYARRLLRNSAMGTFLIRDSSDPNYLYSLTVKTEKGATSVRIVYSDGLFQFDCDEKLRHRLPRFESVMSLVDHHTMLSRDGKNQRWRWEENSGKKMMKVVLFTPRKRTVCSLQHLSRVRINQCLENVHFPALSVDCLSLLPVKLKDYLKDYPYRV